MNFSYDPIADASYLQLITFSNYSDETEEIAPNINLDFKTTLDQSHPLVFGIELLDFTQKPPSKNSLALLEQALKTYNVPNPSDIISLIELQIPPSSILYKLKLQEE